MKITYANIKGFKRFRFSGINDFEAHFKAPVQVIIGTSGLGKSSLLRELCPLPSVRTDYEPGGKKELHIEHEGDSYILISDFTSKTSPHSFRKNKEELNISGTTEVQTDLVEKHFGINSTIRNLIYSKIKLCQTTKSERKNLFLNINPMELGIILDTHKSALSMIKDRKSQLALLYSRREDISSRLIDPSTLQNHIATKQQFIDKLSIIDKTLYSIDQHISNIHQRFSEDIEYQKHCAETNKQLIPSDMILRKCKEIIHNASLFTDVVRGPEHESTKQELHIKQQNLKKEKDNLQNQITNISNEINEYYKHLESATERPIDSIEKELEGIEQQLSKYGDLPENGIPAHLLDLYTDRLNSILKILFVFRDCGVKMLPPKDIVEKMTSFEQLQIECDGYSRKMNELKGIIDSSEKELQDWANRADIPKDCISMRCGLRGIFDKRKNELDNRLTETKAEYSRLDDILKEKNKVLKESRELLAPYKNHDLLVNFHSLSSLLKDGYFNLPEKDWDNNLIFLLNTQPMTIHSSLDEFIINSKLKIEHDVIKARHTALSTELDIINKSSGASLDFLVKKVKEKEKEVKSYLSKLDLVTKEENEITNQIILYLEYTLVADQLKTFQQIYTKGERAILVSKAIWYWQELGKYLSDIKHTFNEELRKLETIVREQETLRFTYENEILTFISKLEYEKKLYEKIELSLSPTTGLPHRSMVKYLNAMIGNVNYFLSQLWSYRMNIFPLEMERALDYNFRLEVGSVINGDISQLSDGQSEMVNLAWVLTILLQLRMLDKTPFFADEVGIALDSAHRLKLLQFLDDMIANRMIEQMFIVSHYTAFIDGFKDSDIISLGGVNEAEFPKMINEHVRFN